jgi:hypothetical protein
MVDIVKGVGRVSFTLTGWADVPQSTCKRGVYLPSWSVHHNFVRDGRYNERGWAMGMHPPPFPGWANLSIMTECTPESGNCSLSVYSVEKGTQCLSLVTGQEKSFYLPDKLIN